MTEKRTLTLRPASERPDAPSLKKKGRGWEISESRRDALHDAAREMKRNPSPAETALAEGLTAANLGKYKLHRHVVIGSAIVDFACQPLKLVVMLDREGVAPEIAQRADRHLAAVGLSVLRVAESEILADRDAVVARIVAALKSQWEARRAATPQRRASSPRGGQRSPYARNHQAGNHQG